MSNANEPAFAGLQFDDMPGGGARIVQVGGLTKREYFAAMAMQGYASDHKWRVDTSPEMTARAAIFMADALIAELERAA